MTSFNSHAKHSNVWKPIRAVTCVFRSDKLTLKKKRKKKLFKTSELLVYICLSLMFKNAHKILAGMGLKELKLIVVTAGNWVFNTFQKQTHH